MMFASGEFKWLRCTFRRVRFICNDIVNKFVRALSVGGEGGGRDAPFVDRYAR